MEVLSVEQIQPSSSTPQHLQKFYFSFLDQKAPPTYVGLVFFYESAQLTTDVDSTQISQKLKQSLSNVLTSFYFLAGRIDHKSSFIDCNDDGVLYVVARVYASMADSMSNPDPQELQKYAPMAPDGDITPLLVQLNLFDCGGIAVSVRVWHKIADMESLVIFLNAWAATCRNGVEATQALSFDLKCLFPPVEDLWTNYPPPPTPPPAIGTPVAKNIVTKRLLFNNEMLIALKNVGASTEVTNPSKIEAVTAYLWRNFIVASSQKPLEGVSKSFAAIHIVNMRSKVSPPLPKHSFGNGCLPTVANWSEHSKTDDEEEEAPEYPMLVAKLRSAIRNINSDYVIELQKNAEYDYRDFDKPLVEGAGDLSEVYGFTSWCRFPFYEVDYGWGNPHWVSTFPAPFRNLTVFMDTKSGDGIEAWITMTEEDMGMIEASYKNLLNFTCSQASFT